MKKEVGLESSFKLKKEVGLERRSIYEYVKKEESLRKSCVFHRLLFLITSIFKNKKVYKCN